MDDGDDEAAQTEIIFSRLGDDAIEELYLLASDTREKPVAVHIFPARDFTDVRVRKAANLAIDRDAIVKLLNGTVRPAYGEVDRTSPWFGKPTFVIKYAPDEARKLITEAGYSKAKPMTSRITIQASGTTQMVNEAIQEMLKECWINIEFKPVELEEIGRASCRERV